METSELKLETNELKLEKELWNAPDVYELSTSQTLDDDGSYDDDDDD